MNLSRFHFVLSNHGLGGKEGTACSQSSITVNMTHIPPPVSAQHQTCSTTLTKYTINIS